MVHLMLSNCRLNRATAERVVELFLAGAAAKSRAAAVPSTSPKRKAKS